MAMRIEAGEDVKRGDSFRVWPANIKVNPDNRGRVKPRTREEIRELADSILEHGQRTPVEFRRLADNTLELVYGYTRYEAVVMINTEIRPDEPLQLRGEVIRCNEKEAFLHNIVENQHRNATSPIDDAVNQRRLREDHGMKNAEIARLYRCSPNKPGQLEKLLLLDDEQQEKVHNGELSIRAALDLLEVGPAELAEVTDVNGDIDQEALDEKKREARAARGQNTTRTIKQIRTFFTTERDETKSPHVQRFCKDFLKFLNGQVGDQGLRNALGRLLEAEDDEEFETLEEAA